MKWILALAFCLIAAGAYAQTGTGSIVLQNGPTIVAPVVSGAATVTGATTVPSGGSITPSGGMVTANVVPVTGLVKGNNTSAATVAAAADVSALYGGASGSGTLCLTTGCAINLAAGTGLPLTTGVSQVLPAANGGAVAIYPSALTAVGIQAAMAAAGTAGGGIVQLPAGTISLSTSLTPVQGVCLIGIAPQVNTTNGIPDNPDATFSGGTVLAPSGSFPAISFNTTALGTPASQAAFTSQGLFNVCFKDLGFSGGTYGIQAGATNAASFWYPELENLYFEGQTSWAVQLLNFQHAGFRRIYSFGATNGQLYRIDVPTAILQPGNSTWYDLYNVIPSSGTTNWASRGIVFNAANTVGEIYNEFKLDRIQSNRFNATSTTQAATMTNTSANITVTDGTKFAVGMPVTFSATANGFTLGKIYFVTSISTNVLQVATTQGGATPVSATGSTAVNIIQNGWPAFEFTGSPGSTIINGVISNLDVEGGGTCAAFFQNANGVKIDVSQVPLTSQSTQALCLRNSNNSHVFAPNGVTTDIDGNNANSYASHFYGTRTGTSVGYMGAGIWYDTVSGNTCLSLGSQFDTQSTGALCFNPSNGNQLGTGPGIFLKSTFSGTATPTLSNLASVYSNSSTGTTITLPAITASNLGQWLTLVNTTASAQTVNTNGTQLFNGKSGLTSWTVPANGSVSFYSGQSGSSTYTWVVGGTTGITQAAADTSNSLATDAFVATAVATAAPALSIPTGTATFAGGSGITSVVCATGYSCNNTRGTLTIVGGTATTGTIATVTFSAALSAAPACFASMNGGATVFSIGNSAPTTTAFNITAGISVIGSTFNVNYVCQP